MSLRHWIISSKPGGDDSVDGVGEPRAAESSQRALPPQLLPLFPVGDPLWRTQPWHLQLSRLMWWLRPGGVLWANAAGQRLGAPFIAGFLEESIEGI